MSKKVLPIYLEESLIEKVKRTGEKCNRKGSSQFKHMLETYINEHEVELEKIENLPRKEVIDKKVTSISLPQELIEVIKNLGKVFGRNMNLQIEYMIKTYIKEHAEEFEEEDDGKES